MLQSDHDSLIALVSRWRADRDYLASRLAAAMERRDAYQDHTGEWDARDEIVRLLDRTHDIVSNLIEETVSGAASAGAKLPAESL